VYREDREFMNLRKGFLPFIFFLILFPPVTASSGFPGGWYGYVSINVSGYLPPAPDGTLVEGYFNGSLYQTTTTSTYQGTPGYYFWLGYGDVLDPGDGITFNVEGLPTNATNVGWSPSIFPMDIVAYCNATACPVSAVIVGNITTPKGAPVGGAILNLTNTTGRIVAVVADEGGSYVLGAPSTQAGGMMEVSLTASKYGYSTNTTSLQVNTSPASGVHYIDLTLEDLPPEINSVHINDTICRTGDAYFLEVKATDLIDDNLTVAANIINSSGAQVDIFSLSLAGGGVYNGSRVVGYPEGSYTVNITVSDGYGNQVYNDSLSLQVDNPPTWLQEPGNRTAEYGQPFYYDINASDLSLESYSIDDTANFTMDPSSGVVTNATVLSLGVYTLNISVNDTGGNSISKSISIRVQDTTPPAWSPAPHDLVAEYGQGFSYDINATDPLLDSFGINDTGNFTMDPTTGILTNATTMGLGQVFAINISVNDTSGNINWTVITVTVADRTPPTWVQEPQDQILEYRKDSLYYDINATDPALDSYTIDDTSNFTIDPLIGVLVNSTALPIGIYPVNISVNDTSGNVRWKVITVTVADNTPPTWVQAPQDRTVDNSLPFTYDLKATDVSGISAYWIKDTSNFRIDQNGTITNATLLAAGNYTINVSVNDTADNLLSSLFTVEVLDTTSPELLLVPPTPNASASLPAGNGSVVINLSILEPSADTLLLNWSGNLTTFSYSSGYWNITKSVSPGKSYTFTIWVNDTRGNNATITRNFTVLSTGGTTGGGGGGGGGGGVSKGSMIKKIEAGASGSAAFDLADTGYVSEIAITSRDVVYNISSRANPTPPCPNPRAWPWPT
jgi:hypothetical protein